MALPVSPCRCGCLSAVRVCPDGRPARIHVCRHKEHDHSAIGLSGPPLDEWRAMEGCRRLAEILFWVVRAYDEAAREG